jgi:hypothetical protein
MVSLSSLLITKGPNLKGCVPSALGPLGLYINSGPPSMEYNQFIHSIFCLSLLLYSIEKPERKIEDIYSCENESGRTGNGSQPFLLVHTPIDNAFFPCCQRGNYMTGRVWNHGRWWQQTCYVVFGRSLIIGYLEHLQQIAHIHPEYQKLPFERFWRWERAPTDYQ